MEKEIIIQTKVNISLEKISYLLISAFEGGSNYWYSFFEYNNKKKPDIEALKKAKVLKNVGDEKYRHTYWALGGEIIIFTNEDLGLKNIKPIKESKEDGYGYTLNMEKIKKGLGLMSEKYPTHFADIINENDDATTGDVFLQLCLFEDIIFG